MATSAFSQDLFHELHDPAALVLLDARFLGVLQQQDSHLHAELSEYRLNGTVWQPQKLSEFLLQLAPRLETFIAQLFDIDDELAKSSALTTLHNGVLEFKKQFVLKRARHFRGRVERPFSQLDEWLDNELCIKNAPLSDREWAVSQFARKLLQDESAHAQAIEQLTQWCVLCMTTQEGRRRVNGWVSFRMPLHKDYARLVALQRKENDPAQRLQMAPDRLRQREGFGLTDARMSAREIQGEVHYCIYCHQHEGDFCSKGFPRKKGVKTQDFAVNPLGETLTGCPLEEKVSEMHALKRDGHTIAALAVVMVDNPMVPATGHRICNDCMKSCIYQKQEPVDIPQIETHVLTDVLQLPWGVEIYDLLTQWNPLRSRQYVPKTYNGRKVLIAGLGPAGFTMAHHLTMEGCAVVAIDGLKIEPLAETLLSAPVRDYHDLIEPLDKRVMAGFGGVAEYGITARWDKNFLQLIHLTLARRRHLKIIGSTRWGGTVTVEDAWRLGFDHVCIATGTGLPKIIPMGNSLAKGMKQANDFLMALQLTGAAKPDSLVSLQVRLPAVVIGGGLTAIDAATELQAYYLAQIDKILQRYELLVATHGAQWIQDQLDEDAYALLQEYLQHGRALRKERERAAAHNLPPDLISLLRRWGGVTIVYRRSLEESPAYLRNHEEIGKALEEGLYYAEGLEPVRVELDRFNHTEKLVCRRRARDATGKWLTSWDEVVLPAKTVLVAAGTTPNIIYEIEHPGTFALEGDHFLAHVVHREGLQPVGLAQHCKSADFGAFTSYQQADKKVSFIGDTHPVFHGSVVKAIASAARSYSEIMKSLELLPKTQSDEEEYAIFARRVEEALTAKVEKVRRIAPFIVELSIKAPQAARNFMPGQFFRVQNYERQDGTKATLALQTGPLTLSGAGVQDADKLRMMVLEASAGSRLCATLKPGDPIALMGPTGAATEIHPGETVMVVGGKWASAVMLSLGPAQRAAGNRVLFFATFRDEREVYCREDLENAVDQIVWCASSAPAIRAQRAQDSSAVGDCVDIIERYAKGELGYSHENCTPLPQKIDRILVLGSLSLLCMMKAALQNRLGAYFRQDVKVVGTVGSPMQCMLKGVCAQCLQWQIDPETGQRTRAVFACAMQDQPLSWIDLDNLAARIQQNTLMDRLNNLWLDHYLKHHSITRV